MINEEWRGAGAEGGKEEGMRNVECRKGSYRLRNDDRKI